MKVLDHSIQIEALEFLGVIERFAHRIGQGGVLVENLKVQLVWPPVTVCVCVAPARERALTSARVSLCVHVFLRSCFAFSYSVYNIGGVRRE